MSPLVTEIYLKHVDRILTPEKREVKEAIFQQTASRRFQANMLEFCASYGLKAKIRGSVRTWVTDQSFENEF